MNREKDSQGVGVELTRFAASDKNSVKYGRITEMFPYIYQASQVMGIRAISRWLEEQGTPISHATISRALGNPEPHWEGFWTIIEPHARRVSEKFATPMADFLFDDIEHFEAAVKALPCIVDADEDTVIYEAEAAESSVDFLRAKWFPLAKATRAHLRPYAAEEVAE